MSSLENIDRCSNVVLYLLFTVVIVVGGMMFGWICWFHLDVICWYFACKYFKVRSYINYIHLLIFLLIYSFHMHGNWRRIFFTNPNKPKCANVCVRVCVLCISAADLSFDSNLLLYFLAITDRWPKHLPFTMCHRWRLNELSLLSASTIHFSSQQYFRHDPHSVLGTDCECKQ